MGRPHDRRCPHLASPRFERSPMLSSSYRNRLARQMPEEEEAPPPPPEPDLIVTGTLNPDSTGDYFQAGTHNGQPYYARDDDAWFIWYLYLAMFDKHRWHISDELGDTSRPYWRRDLDALGPPPGSYGAQNGATGLATVAEP